MDETPAPTNATPVQPPAGKKILLVEDDQNLADVYVMRLQAEGYAVKHEPDGEEALGTAVAFKPDLILLDIMMPKLSGFDVLDILRNTPQTAHTKVVMLSALGDVADKERAKQLGANGFLVKSQVLITDVVDQVKAQLAS